jgi:hypothetical protein
MTTYCSRRWSRFGSPEVVKGGHVRTLSRGEHAQGCLRSPFVAVEEKSLIAQQGMERVSDSHWLWAVIIDRNWNRSVNKSNQPIQNPLLLVTEPRTRVKIIKPCNLISCVEFVAHADACMYLHRTERSNRMIQLLQFTEDSYSPQRCVIHWKTFLLHICSCNF